MITDSDSPRTLKLIAIVTSGIIISFLIFATISHFIRKEKFENPDILKKETIGVITEFQAGASTAPSFNYEFTVDGEVYDGSYLIVTILGQKTGDELREYVGKKYKILYVVDDPKYSNLLMDKSIE